MAVSAGAAAVRFDPNAWWWVSLIAVVIAAGAPPMTSVLAKSRERRSDTAKAARQALQGTIGSGGDILPLASDADLEMRVHRAVLALPYIRRDAEEHVVRLLNAGQPVLLVGSSMVGKTRLAAAVIRENFATRRVVIPDTREALASMDAADVALRETVIFLDDLNRLVGAGGITDGALQRLAAGNNVVIGTIRATEYDRYQPTDQVRPPEWDVIHVFERVFLNRELSNAEQFRPWLKL